MPVVHHQCTSNLLCTLESLSENAAAASACALLRDLSLPCSPGTTLWQTIFGGEATAPDHQNIATAVFSHPQIGTVGMSEEQARRMHARVWGMRRACSRLQRQQRALCEGWLPLRTPLSLFACPQAVAAFGDVDVYTSSFRPMRNTIRHVRRMRRLHARRCSTPATARTHQNTRAPPACLPACCSGNPGRTFMKLVVAAESQRVVGVHMVGPDSAEIMQGMGVAVKLGVTKPQLDSVVGIHPSGACVCMHACV